MNNHTQSDAGGAETADTQPGHDASGHSAAHSAHGEKEHEGHTGHGGHAGHGDHVGMFRRLFWSMLVLAVPVIVASEMFAMLLGYSLPDAAWIAWISPVLGTVMYAWGGSPFLTVHRE